MEQSQAILNCKSCKSIYTENDSFCGTCGYPFKASEEDQKKFRKQYLANKLETENAQKKVKEAKIILFVIAGFTLLSSIILYLNQNDLTLMITNGILSMVYLSLGFWANKKAFPAILTGGIIYVSVILLNAFIEPLTLFSGIIWKIIFIGALIKGAYGAYQYNIEKASAK